MAQIALRAAQRLPKTIRVEWEDGFSAHFSYVWMRDNANRRPALIHLDFNERPELFYADSSKVQLTWPAWLEHDYTSKFLRDHTKVKPVAAIECPVTQKVLTVPWRVLPFYPRNEVFTKGSLATLQVAETYLEPGTVWPQLERIPSLCTVEAHTPGAKVTLVDAVKVLSLMSATHRDQFDFLMSAPIDYAEDLFHACHPIATIRDGKIVAATFSNTVRSAEISVDSVERYYQCLKTFNQICLDIAHIVVIEPGQVLVVDNHQTLIGAPAQRGRKLVVDIFN